MASKEKKTKKHRIKRDYAKTASTYNKRYAATQFEKFKVLESIDLTGKTVLDLGGGTGMLGKYLKRQDLINIDISFEMLQKSGEINVCADLDHLPLKTGCIDAVSDSSERKEKLGFDFIVSFTAVQNLPDFSRVFKEARRVLAPDGTFVCSVLDKVDLDELETAAEPAGFKIDKKIKNGEDVCFVLA